MLRDLSSLLFLICLTPLLLPGGGCSSTGQNTGSKTRSPYEVPGSFEATGRTDRDKQLTQKIRKIGSGAATPKREFRLLAGTMTYLSGLQTDEIANRVRGTGGGLTPLLTGEASPGEYAGHWYRLRGTPVSVPQQKPFQGKLDLTLDLQQFLMKNPFVFRDVAGSAYYEIITTKPLPDLGPSEQILEVDGLLWKTWSISADETGRFQDTDQVRIPTFLITNYRVVDEP